MNKYAGILAATLAINGADGCATHPSKPEMNPEKVNPHEMIVLDMVNNGKMIVHECISDATERSTLRDGRTSYVYFEKNDPKSFDGTHVLRLGDGQIMRIRDNSDYCKLEEHKYSSAFDEKKTDGPAPEKQSK